MVKQTEQILDYDSQSFGELMERGRAMMALRSIRAGILDATEFGERYEEGLRRILERNPHYLEERRRIFSGLRQ